MKFNVIGADRETGEDIEMTIDAADESAAQEVARRKGIMVSHIGPALAVRAPPAAPRPFARRWRRGTTTALRW